MNNKLNCIAFHEAEHAVAHILTGIPFKYVTIKEDEIKDEFDGRTLGHVFPVEPVSKEEWEKQSILNPQEFNIFFKEDFVRLSGFVAEKIYQRKANYKSSQEDFRQWEGLHLLNYQRR